MVGQIELAFRVLIAIFVIVAPTLLFLGLWRGLEAMQDDELVERARQQGYLESSPSVTNVTTAMFPATGDGHDRVICDHCGTPNLADATFCQECLEKLPERS